MELQILRVAKDPIIRESWKAFAKYLNKSNINLDFHLPVSNTEELESQLHRIHIKPTLVISDSKHTDQTKKLLIKYGSSKTPFKVVQMSGGDMSADKHIQNESGKILRSFIGRLSPHHQAPFKIPQPFNVSELKGFFKDLQELLRDERE